MKAERPPSLEATRLGVMANMLRGQADALQLLVNVGTICAYFVAAGVFITILIDGTGYVYHYPLFRSFFITMGLLALFLTRRIRRVKRVASNLREESFRLQYGSSEEEGR